MGGASRSKLWMELLASTAGCQVIKLNEPNAACLGAAAIAGAGCGMFGSLIEGAQAVRETEVLVEPEKGRADYYGQKYLKYKKGIDAVDRFYSGIL